MAERWPFHMEWREGPGGTAESPIIWKCSWCPMRGQATTVAVAEGAALRHTRRMHSIPGVLVDGEEPVPPEDD